MGQEYTSRHNIGEIVFFQPNLEKIDWKNMEKKENTDPVKAKIMKVSFNPGKITYDIAVEDKINKGTGFYETVPICNVDSVMILPVGENDGKG